MRRTFLGFLLFFAAGLALGYGLSYLDGQTRIPRLGPTDVFEVAMPDGTYRHLTYAEVERERADLRQLRQQLARRADPAVPSRPAPADAPEPTPDPPETPETVRSREPVPEDSRKQLGELFTRIFSRPVMQEIALAQVKRQAGELSAVLGLTEEQRATLEAELEKRRLEQMQARGRPAPGRPGTFPGGEQDIEAVYRSLFTPEQYRRYELYTERKKEVRGSSVPEQELFELAWRLDLTEEQEARAGEILRSQWERVQRLSPMTGSAEDESSPLEQFQQYLDTRSEIVNQSIEQFRTFLDEDQLAGYRQYVSEKELETSLLEKMVRPDTTEGAEAAP